MQQNQLVHQNGERLFVTSLDISNRFAKRHDNVRLAINNLDCSEQFRRLNFKEIKYTDGKGRQQPMYEITRDGFVFLCMGFTGSQAALWKERYIEAFNQMERALRGNMPMVVQQQQLGLAREIGALRDQLLEQNRVMLSLFERLTQSQKGQIRVQDKLTKVIERERNMLARQEKAHARETILKMEAEGVPRDEICLATGRTLNHVRQVIWQAKRDGVFPQEVSHAN